MLNCGSSAPQDRPITPWIWIASKNTIPKEFVRQWLPTCFVTLASETNRPSRISGHHFSSLTSSMSFFLKWRVADLEESGFCWEKILGSYYSNGASVGHVWACWCLNALRYGMNNFVDLPNLQTCWSDSAGFEILTESWPRFVQLWCTWGSGTCGL